MTDITTRLAKVLRTVIGLTALFAISVTAGAVAGVSALGVVAPREAQAHESCEQDECERYRVWWTLFIVTRERCEDNAGQETGCEITGEHSCVTYGCYPKPPGSGGGPGDGDQEE